MDKVSTCLWFAKDGEEAANFYVSLFRNSSIKHISRHGEGGQLPAGTAMLIDFQLEGRDFAILNAGPHFELNEAMSLVIDCVDQAEVDKYWDTLTADGGEESMCGWLKDKYGVSWQLVPQSLVKMMNAPEKGNVDAMFQSLMTMKKPDIATLEAAYANK